VLVGAAKLLSTQQDELNGREETRELVHSSLKRVASGVFDAYGCTCQVDIIRGYPVTINDPAMAQLVEQAAERTLGTGRYMTAAKPIVASEDFS
jgi:hippurate hydrolase